MWMVIAIQRLEGKQSFCTLHEGIGYLEDVSTVYTWLSSLRQAGGRQESAPSGLEKENLVFIYNQFLDCLLLFMDNLYNIDTRRKP